MAPKVSVISSVHNGESSLKGAIESVLNQTMADFEFVIVDDASTDGSADILERFDDPRIVVLKNDTRIGLTASLNRAFDLTRGEFIARQDDDDFSLPKRFEQQVKFLESYSEVGVVGSQMEVIDEEGNFLEQYSLPSDHGILAWNLFFERSFAHPSVMIRRELLSKVGGYDEDYLVSQDHKLWSRLVLETRFANLPEVLLRYQSSDKSISQRRVSEQYSNRMRVRQELAEQLLEQEVPLKVIKWMDNSQQEDCALKQEQQKAVLELIYELYSAMRERGIIREEDDAAVYSDLLERILQVGKCGDGGQKGESSESFGSKISWAISNPGKAAKKLLVPGKGSGDRESSQKQEGGNRASAALNEGQADLSIIVLTHQREAGLTELLESLLTQHTNAPVYELILVNNSPERKLGRSSDGKVGKLIDEFSDSKIINNSHNWGTKARYSVAALASSETILFLDDDLILLDEHFLEDMYSAYLGLNSVDILSCWNELWLEWGEEKLRSVALDFLTPGIDEMILSDSVGPGIAMFNRNLLHNPKIMDVAMQRNQENPIVSDMGFSLAASMFAGSEKYYFPAYGKLAFHEEAHSGAIYQIPKRHQDLLGLYKRLSREGFKPVMERLAELPKNQAERASWAAESLASKEYAW